MLGLFSTVTLYNLTGAGFLAHEEMMREQGQASGDLTGVERNGNALRGPASVWMMMRSYDARPTYINSVCKLFHPVFLQR